MSKTIANCLVLGIMVLVGVDAISVDQFLSMTLSQKIALDQFRAKVMPILPEDCMRHDTYLIRWLRARNFDIDSAERMLKENLKWRKENRIDNIKNENWSDLSDDFHMTLDTVDKIGSPVGVCDIYEWDIRRAMLQGKGQRLIRYVTGIMENLTAQACEKQQKGMSVTQVIILLNAEGFNVIQQACPICLSLWIQFAGVIDNYYPEWLDEIIVIDASAAVQIVLNVVRPILSQSTNNAIKIFGPNKSKWMPYLDNKISRSERRKAYGGTRPPFKY